ncbi:hypothetical protein L596_001094 [Steinernema carpocapsae]|uniref:Uncharacterized protein n=1 Tax=Steinernema carpocapsae TaxID=34508 RepID=A0A4U8UMC2_STECR|nr:hypothetical protein L596_001094 [Steinernema carpocapsae]
MIVKPQIWSNSACGILPHLVRSTSGHLSGRRKLGEVSLRRERERGANRPLVTAADSRNERLVDATDSRSPSDGRCKLGSFEVFGVFEVERAKFSSDFRNSKIEISSRILSFQRNITDREEIRTPVVSSFVLFDLGITHPNLFQICFFRTSSCPKLRTTDPTN